MEKEMLSSIQNFIDALVYSHYMDEQEMYDLVWHMAERKVNNLRALDPARNR
jgi:hypothetical protein